MSMTFYIVVYKTYTYEEIQDDIWDKYYYDDKGKMECFFTYEDANIFITKKTKELNSHGVDVEFKTYKCVGDRV